MSLEVTTDLKSKPIKAQEKSGQSGETSSPGGRVHASRRHDPASLTEPSDLNFKASYILTMSLIERLHKLLLDVIKDEFERLGRSDVNSVQAYLIYHIGDDVLSAGELRSRGYYLGSNVSYNLKKLVNGGFLSYERSSKDRRSVRIRLTEKGLEICQIVDRLFARHLRSLEQVGGLAPEDLKRLNRSLQQLERFWSDQIRYRL